MNYDITGTDGPDLRIQRTDVSKAGNVLSVQIGSLEYAPNFGIDLKFFLESDFQIQTESFMSYCVGQLLAHQVGVIGALEVIGRLDKKITFEIGDRSAGTELIG